MALIVQGRVLVPGEAEGPLLQLSEPLSFWGGVDPNTGLITQPRHPGHGRSVAGTILAMPSGIGSSSSSAVLLELIHNHRAPAALLMGEADAILALGVVVAREMGFGSIPVLECTLTTLRDGTRLSVTTDGIVQKKGTC